MKFKLTKDVLARPLQIVTGIVERKQTLPVLSNVLVVAKNDEIVITGTDMEVEMVCRISADVEEAGSVTLPARKLNDIWKNLSDFKSVRFEQKDQRVELRSEQSRFTLGTLPVTEFPVVDDIGVTFSIAMPQRELRRLIEKTAFAMAQQDVRFYLLGLLLELTPESIRCVATDGHRLALAEYRQATHCDAKKQMIVPRKAVSELLKLLSDSEDEVVLEFGENHIRTQLGEIRFTSKLIDGKYPDYQRAIPEHSSIDLVLDKQEIRQALQRAAVLSNDKLKGVKLHIQPDLLTIQAHNPEQEEAEDKIAIQYSGRSISVGFNVNYLLEAINVITTENVILGLTDERGSALMQGVDEDLAKFVIMPMNL